MHQGFHRRLTQTWKITRNATYRKAALDGLASEAPPLPIVPRSLDEFNLPPRSDPDKRRERLKEIIVGANATILKDVRAVYHLGTGAGDNKALNVISIATFLMGSESDMPDERVL
jgi:hypothetical protein